MDPFISNGLSFLILALDEYVTSGGADVKVIEPLVHQIKLYIIALVNDMSNRDGEPDSLMLLAVFAILKEHPVLSLLLPYR